MAKAHIYMAPGANVESTDTFASWIETTNSLVFDMGTVVLTSVTQPQPNTAVGGYTVGNSHLQGIFSANTLVVSNGLRGGSVSTNNDLVIVSSTVFSESPVIRITANTESFIVNANNTIFANNVLIANTTDATSSTSAPFKTNGGLAIAKRLYVGGQTFTTANVNIGFGSSLVAPNVVANTMLVNDTGTFNNLNVLGNAIFNSGAQLSVNNAIATHSVVTDDITLTNATVIGSINPDANNSYDIGTTSLLWRTIYANNVVANVSFTNITDRPDPKITVSLTGDVEGSANTTLTNLADGTISIATTIQQNSVTLGTDTTGNYVGTIASGTPGAQSGTSGLTISAAVAEGTSATIAHADTSSIANLSVSQSDGTVLQNLALTFDGFGHVTGVTTGSTDLDLRYVRSAFQNIAVAGQSTVVSDALSDTLTLAAAGTVSITTSSTTDTITFTGAATNLSITPGTTAGPIILSSTGTGVTIPTAGPLASGIVTNGAQTFAGIKTFSSTIDGNAATATRLATARTITLAGDVEGSVSFSGERDVSMTVTVYDDSHNHIISNVDGLQGVLDSKLPLSGGTITGQLNIQSGAPTIYLNDTGGGNFYIHVDGSVFYLLNNAFNPTGFSVGQGGNLGCSSIGTGPISCGNINCGVISSSSIGTGTINCGTINSSGTISAAGNITALSDARLKENVVTIDSALDKVSQMRGVYYNRIDEETKTRNIGVIAQEIEAVLPEVVHTREDDTKSVAYGNIVGILIEAIKELNEEVKTLRSMLDV
jgi:hypothetical protein